MAIIALSGKISAGKDLTGKIIQILTCDPQTDIKEMLDILSGKREMYIDTTWQIKKFADKLKQCTSIITGIPRFDLESNEVKNSNLPEEWSTYKFKAGNGEYYHFGTKRDIETYNKHGFNVEPLSVRAFLQKFGTDACRDNIHPDFWVNALFADYKPSDNWIITDVRFPNELNAVDQRDGLCLRLTRNSDNKSNHISETALDNAVFDYVIDNDGTIEELIEKVRGILLNEKLI